MTPVAPADHAAVLDRLHRYAWASDEREFAALAACFSADAVHRIEGGGGPAQVVAGADAIARWVEERHAEAFARGVRRRHVIGCTVVERATDERLRARSYFQVVEAAPGQAPAIASFGRYDDTLVREGGQWLLCVRVVQVDGRA
jgi:3-phenylpropionate/cinnamic acid dioxygenase small subunit